MAKMDVINSGNFLRFNKDEQDVVKCGVDLYKHYLYTNKSKTQYAEFAQGASYEEKEKLFTEGLMREAFKRAGVANAGFKDEVMMRSPNVQWAVFALLSETLSVIIPNTVLNSFERFAEVRNGNWGDNFKFTIPNPDLFVVSKTAQGIRRGEPQRIYNGEVFLTPSPREITIQEDWYRVVAGKVNFGDWVTRIAQSVETDITTMVYSGLYGSYAGLNANFKEATYDKDQFVKLAQRVSAANRGAKVTVFGTQLALSKVVPNENFANFGVGVGEEYIRMGYLGSMFGVDTLMIDQRLKPNSFDFAIADDSLYFVCMGTDRPVKIGFEGSPLIIQDTATANADLTQNYTYQQSYDAMVATSARYGIMHV
ncbi:hypothetical protein [Paenibacillus tianjinensis]|uniref:Phage major capsid protein, HK97 family n=1 Tax=Paenibacillus tianjinensis TaxID=2810347 RepID=A0ABX7LC16_9BACL|nr:hypothetical protein [Paenibacillus tianjinensis]QSF43532.1 hypothetical protein JRJ22_19925 [Paenibacillus tianjinensis]